MPKRIRPAKHYQRADNAVRRLSLQARGLVARDLKGALKHLSDLVPEKKLILLVRDGRWREIHGEIEWAHFGEVLKKPFAALGKVWEAGAALGVRKINGSFAHARRRVRFRKIGAASISFEQWASASVSKAIGDAFNFDLYDTNTQAALREAQDELIQQLTDGARDAIETIVQAGALEGLSAEEIVSDIRDLISLTNFQAQAVLNYRSMLESLDSDALQRQLRNFSMDEEVQAAIDNGEMLANDVVDQLVSDYTDNYLDYRASTIAQTESVRAVNSGLHDAYSQAIERGALPDDAVRREWELGDSPCPICESIPDSNPDGVGVDETFDSDDGPIDDPPVHPNACFEGTPFRSYGSLGQIARAKYDGPAIELKAVLSENNAESAARNSRFAESLESSRAIPDHSKSDGDLLVRDSGRPTPAIWAREISLTIGPNHPVLTRRGFVTAREIKEGDELLYDVRAQLADGSGKIDFEQMPLFEDCFSTLADAFETISPTGPRSYFHGDEVFTYGEVEIVFPQRDLLPVWDSGFVQHLCKCSLMGTYTNPTHIAGCRACQERFDLVFRAASGLISRSDCGRALGFTKPLPSCFHSARIVSAHKTSFVGYAFDASAENAIYSAGGLVVKNCMCSVNYITDISKVPDDSESDTTADEEAA